MIKIQTTQARTLNDLLESHNVSISITDLASQGLLSFLLGHNCSKCIGVTTYNDNNVLCIPQYLFEDKPTKVSMSLSSISKNTFNSDISVGVYYFNKNVYISSIGPKKMDVVFKTTSDKPEEICTIILSFLCQYIKQTYLLPTS